MEEDGAAAVRAISSSAANIAANVELSAKSAIHATLKSNTVSRGACHE
jgi:hypothetical protein